MNDQEAYDYYADPANRELTGAPRKRKGQQLSSMSSVRFAPDAIEAVKNIASEEGITVGSWMRRLVGRELERTGPEVMEVAVAGVTDPLRLPADVLRSLFAAMMPALIEHGSVELRIGPLGAYGGTAGFTTTAPVSVVPARESERQRREWLDAHRGELAVVPGSGRAAESRSIPSSLQLRSRSFACPHFSIGNVTHATCETCGPLVGIA